MDFILRFRCCRRSSSSRHFFAVLYHYGVMQLIIKAAAQVMTKFMGASGAESLNVAAYLHGADGSAVDYSPISARSHALGIDDVMTSGMAHVSAALWLRTSRSD